MNNVKFALQDRLYKFPYHYLTDLKNDTPQIGKNLHWGFEYLSYMSLVRSELYKLDFDTILDIGCGDGYLLNTLDKKCEKHGVDLSEKAISFAKAFSVDAKFEVLDIFDIKKQYDIVSLIEVIEHISDEFLPDFIKQAISLINGRRERGGGYLVISVPTTAIPLNKKHYRHYTEELLDEHLLLSSGKLRLISSKRVYIDNFLLRFFIKFLNNGFWSINKSSVLKMFWSWYSKNGLYVDNLDTSNVSDKKWRKGGHIVRVYKKV